MHGKRLSLLLIASAFPLGAAQAQVMDWQPIIQAEGMGSAMAEAGSAGSGTSAPAKQSPSLLGDLAASFAAQTATGTPSSAQAVSATYQPSAQVREKLAGIMGDAAAKQNPANGAEMRQLVLSGKALAEYEKVAPALGLRPNDAIDAYAFYMLAQWGVANDYRADITPAQAAGVRRQAAHAYAGVADQVATDALRQEFGEMLAIQGAILAGVHEAAAQSGDEAALAKYAALARQGGQKIFDMDPTAMALTDDGFRKKS